ncbi:MAG: hypothetical protein V1797_00345 [Pseudomonadota bacterium]
MTADSLDAYLEAWPADQAGLKKALVELRQAALALAKASEAFIARPGVSHSLRYDLAPRPAGRARQVFFLVDVVEDAGVRFLSVCFYEDEVDDPEELGNAIPQGLFAETGYCFDVDGYDPEQMAYLLARLKVAHRSASAA